MTREKDTMDLLKKEDATALKDFLLDIDCLDPLYGWTNQFNLFDILKITRTEIRHSNVLSWLLNPNENHGFGDAILRGFIQYAITAYSDDDEIFDTLLMDCYDFTVQREWHHIDIIAVSFDKQFVLCIENKIDSDEHDNQLDRYRTIVEQAYKNFKRIYVYLSPQGTEPSEPDWLPMSYEEVLNVLENAKRKTNLLPEAELLIDNYIATIRRDIVGDGRLEQICAEIYAKHQKALDLIYENRPDRASRLAEILRKWAATMEERKELIFVPEKSTKTYTRFMTPTMSKLLPDADHANSGWGTKNYYFYEIRNNGGEEFFIQLAISSKDIPSNLRDVCDKIIKHYPSKRQKTNWQWRTIFVTKHAETDEDFSRDEDAVRDEIFMELTKQFEEIKKFETELEMKLREDR